MTATQTKQWYMGRNIGKDSQGYYIAFSDKDRTSNREKVNMNHFVEYENALKQLKYLNDNGWAWFDPHFDPTI